MTELQHCDEDTLRALAQGTLAVAESAQVRQHVRDCPECSRRLAEVDPLSGETVEHGARPPGPGEVISGSPGRALEPGSRVDRYLILERLGAGGMGEIYAAFDPELDRKIALKLMRADVLSAMGTRIGRASLLAEAKALARLNHPNVVAIHDVGEVNDEIFIAMELVEGQVLSDWLADRRPPPAEVLQVFKMAGRGLAAAHAVGLVHRDFKPLNVIVGRDGRARVLDFGLAQAAAAAPADRGRGAGGHKGDNGAGRTPSTEESTQRALIGTPAYMSPEQLRQEPIDARTDQFSFAVSLYEALHGSRPFYADSPEGLLQAIQRGPAPPPAKSAAPAWIHALLVRALSFDREARFPGMGALLEALERDPTVRRRQRWRAAGVTLAAAAVVAGAVAARSTAQRRCAPPESRWAGVWDDARRAGVRQAFARTGKPFARAASDTVDRALDRYRADWLSMLQASCLATLDGAQPRDVLDLRTDCLDRRLAGARALVERLAAADGTVVQNAVSAVGDLQPVSECADEQALRAGAAWPLDPARRGEVEAVRAQVESARALNAVGSMAAALEVARGAAARAEATGYKPLIADAELLLSLVHFRLYDTQSAIAASHRAAAAAQETGQMDLVIQAWIHLTHWTATEGGDGSPWSAYTEALLHRRSGDTRVLWASLRRSQAVVALDSRRYPQAMALARESLELSQQALGEDHPQSSQALRTMAAAAWYLGDLEAALAAHRRGAEIERRVEGLDHPRYAEHLADMAGISIEQGDWEGALRLLDQAEPIFKRAFPARHPWRTMMVQYRAMALAHQEVERGAPLGAEAMAREELKALEQSAGRDDEWAVSLSAVLGNVLRIHGRCAEAVPIFQRVRDTLAPHAVTAEQQWDLAEAREELGACLLATGKPDRALPELRQSVKWFEENGSRNFLRGEGLYLLAQAQWQTGARDGARASAAAARELLAAVSPRGRKLAAEVDRWIAAR